MSCTRPLLLAVAIATAWFSLLILTVTPGQAASVRLSWDAPTKNADGTPLINLAGYKVYYGLASRNYGTPIDVGNTTTYRLSNLTGGQRYYFAVKAYDTLRNESAFSSEVSFVPSLDPSLVANFSAASAIGTAPLAVTFTDTSTGSLQSWNWTFGDGGASTTRNPTHTYHTPGTYTVSLKITSVNNSTDTMTKTGHITILRTGLVGVYGFDEGSGTPVNDLSGEGNHGTISGASRTSSGRYGKALSFDGSSISPENRRSADRTSSGNHSQTLTTSPDLLTSTHLDIGEVDVDQSWKRVTLRKPFVDPVVIAKSLSYREAELAVVRVRHIEPTGFEISLQSWDESSRPPAPETVGYLVIERGRFHLADGTSLESGTVDTDPAYPVHAIAFSQPFRVAPVVMTAITTVQGAMAVTGRPTRVSRQGMQLHLQSQGQSSHPEALQTVSYVAWEPSTSTLDGLVFEVSSTRVTAREQFQSIPCHQSFAMAPVFLADIQYSWGGNPINVRWDQKAREGVDVKIDDVPNLDAEETETQQSDVIGYIMIQDRPEPSTPSR